MSANIKQDHFYRAALEIGQSGENDTLPYDLDAQFVKDNAGSLATVCFDFFKSVEAKPKKQALDFISALNVGSERLLTATGSHGFRICGDQQNAYRALSTLSHAMADVGLSLNRTKTTILFRVFWTSSFRGLAAALSLP
jgi:hypothetical protein